MDLEQELKSFNELEFMPIAGAFESLRLRINKKRNLLQDSSYKIVIPVLFEHATACAGAYISISGLYKTFTSL